jgi:Domain of unknown function (DUF6457)
VENLYAWAARAAEVAGAPAWTAEREAIGQVLDLARDTAHGVARPAAPVGSFIAGVAVGLAGADDPELLARVRTALEATIPEAPPEDQGSA